MADEIVERISVSYSKNGVTVNVAEKTYRTTVTSAAPVVSREVEDIGTGGQSYTTNSARHVFVNRDTAGDIYLYYTSETNGVLLQPGEIAIFRPNSSFSRAKSSAGSVLMERVSFSDA